MDDVADIFLSYASEDRERARSLHAVLAGYGWDVWWDQHLSVGRNFRVELEQKLNEARCVIVLWYYLLRTRRDLVACLSVLAQAAVRPVGREANREP
jgi:TIR domain